MGGTGVLLLVFLLGWEKSLGLNWNPVPRKTVRYQGERRTTTSHRSVALRWKCTTAALLRHSEKVVSV